MVITMLTVKKPPRGDFYGNYDEGDGDDDDNDDDNNHNNDDDDRDDDDDNYALVPVASQQPSSTSY